MVSLNVLFLTRKGEDCVGAPGTRHEFEQEVAKHAECKFAGEGWPLYRAGESMDVTVERVMPDADWVIDKDNDLHNKKPKNRRYRVGVFSSDLHGKHFYETGSPIKYAEMVNDAGYDAVFMRYPMLYGTKYSPKAFLENLGPEAHWVPWSVNPDKFKPRRPFKHDVSFIGWISDVYPLRKRIWEDLYYVARGYRVLRRRAPTGTTFERTYESLKDKFLVGDAYAEAVGSTRILLFGCSRYLYPIQKFFEGTASGCLVMSNAPSMCKQLGFVSRDTFIEVHEGNWEDGLMYFLENPLQAKIIANRGRKLTLENHTHEVRAQQWLEVLE